VSKILDARFIFWAAVVYAGSSQQTLTELVPECFHRFGPGLLSF